MKGKIRDPERGSDPTEEDRTGRVFGGADG